MTVREPKVDSTITDTHKKQFENVDKNRAEKQHGSQRRTSPSLALAPLEIRVEKKEAKKGKTGRETSRRMKVDSVIPA